MNKEEYFIKQLSINKYIGDDGSFIDGFVYSMDAFCENVHFKKEWMDLEQIATKAMLVNISDAIAMNAKPIYALLSVSIPPYYTLHDLDKLAYGFNNIATKYNINIIGGDTISNDTLDISITLISKSNSPLYRKGALLNDLVCYTGTIGESKKDLDRLFQNQKIQKNSKFILPILRDNFIYEARKYINCGLDISDGLFVELERLSKINHIGFDFFDKILNDIGCSGEEYEMLITFQEKYLPIIERIAIKHDTPITIIAKVTKGEFISPCKPHHF